MKCANLFSSDTLVTSGILWTIAILILPLAQMIDQSLAKFSVELFPLTTIVSVLLIFIGTFFLPLSDEIPTGPAID